MSGQFRPVRYFSGKKAGELPLGERQEQLQKLDSIQAFAGRVRGDTGIPGLRLDFVGGCRLEVPEGPWHIRISDEETETVFFDGDVQGVTLVSREKYYVRWHIEAFRAGRLVFSHRFRPEGQAVQFVHNAVGALGDTLAWLPYVRAFRDAYGARVSYSVPNYLAPAARRLLPDIPLRYGLAASDYAAYFMGVGMDGFATAPLDGRAVPLWQAPMAALGFSRPAERLRWKAGPRRIKEPYACIGVQASVTSKGWLWPDGWEQVVRHLQAQGCRVLCIDRERVQEGRGIRISMPAGAEDFTGNISLVERLDMLAHAELFVGLSSGLAWLAELAGCPAVVVSGFSAYWQEFPAAYRVYNRFACNGCVNDLRVNYYKDLFCPYHAGSGRELECMRRIAPQQVMAAIEQVRSDRKNNTLR